MNEVSLLSGLYYCWVLEKDLNDKGHVEKSFKSMWYYFLLTQRFPMHTLWALVLQSKASSRT